MDVLAGSTRLLDDADLPAAVRLAARSPVEHVFVADRLGAAGLDPRLLGAQVWGHFAGERLVALCYFGANLVPVATAGPEAETSMASMAAMDSFAARAAAQGRLCSSIVGPEWAVRRLWAGLAPAWGPARQLRWYQPLLALDRPPQCPADPGVRRVRPDELDLLLPACVAMYTEEVGISPVGRDGGATYRERVAELIAGGRAYARIDGGEVLFKAELGAVSEAACQVQGVWVRPDRRGRGLGAAGTAAVVQLARREHAPLVSLYVNDFNVAARAAYARVGFREVGSFATVLF